MCQNTGLSPELHVLFGIFIFYFKHFWCQAVAFSLFLHQGWFMDPIKLKLNKHVIYVYLSCCMQRFLSQFILVWCGFCFTWGFFHRLSQIVSNRLQNCQGTNQACPLICHSGLLCGVYPPEAWVMSIFFPSYNNGLVF